MFWYNRHTLEAPGRYFWVLFLWDSTAGRSGHLWLPQLALRPTEPRPAAGFPSAPELFSAVPEVSSFAFQSTVAGRHGGCGNDPCKWLLFSGWWFWASCCFQAVGRAQHSRSCAAYCQMCSEGHVGGEPASHSLLVFLGGGWACNHSSLREAFPTEVAQQSPEREGACYSSAIDRTVLTRSHLI